MVTAVVVQRFVLAVFTLLNAAILYLFLLQYPFGPEAFLASLGDWSELGARVGVVLSITVGVALLAVLGTLRLGDARKNQLLYFKLRHAHPAHYAFFGGKEPGFDLTSILRTHPQVRDSAWAPEVQYETWEKLHRKHAGVRVVAGSRQTWYLLRDMYVISVLFLASFLIAWPINFGMVFALAAPYLFVYGAQTLFLLFTARSVGWQLVTNVLGTETGLGTQRDKTKTKRRRR